MEKPKVWLTQASNPSNSSRLFTGAVMLVGTLASRGNNKCCREDRKWGSLLSPSSGWDSSALPFAVGMEPGCYALAVSSAGPGLPYGEDTARATQQEPYKAILASQAYGESVLRAPPSPRLPASSHDYQKPDSYSQAHDVTPQ